ncbi:hypothetical protein ACHWQZ_G016222 [Mnemiopsis leidyi]
MLWRHFFLLIYLATLKVTSATVLVCRYSDYEADVGMFSNDFKIKQREFQSFEACSAWCDQFPDCRAAVVSPSSWAYRECFLVSTSVLTERNSWRTALKEECVGK